MEVFSEEDRIVISEIRIVHTKGYGAKQLVKEFQRNIGKYDH